LSSLPTVFCRRSAETSRLLARQIGATLALDATGPAGTSFSLTLPLGD
jgi:hypothetical protein